METNHQFKMFGKGKKQSRTETNECVVYTRVSSAKQMDGLSLDVQLKAAKEYVEKHKLIAREFFGGTYESAAKDERKEFQRMISYLKTTKCKISKILVYSLERFSRNENSIWLSSQLRRLGIEVVSITQPIDTSNPAGIMQQKMLFIFGEFDNQLRRQKSMAGVKEHLLQGEWVTAPPIGYDIIKHNKERKIVANQTGMVVKKMFYWKAKERMPNVEIQSRLKNLGYNWNLRKIGEILVNPFYCGKMVHKALEGEVVDGKHEKIVSEAIFLEANNIMAEKKLGLQTKKERPEIALKRFMRCAACDKPMRGYIAKDYNMPYYKCNTPGCKCNRNANELNNKFAGILSSFRINPDYIPLIKEQLYNTFQEHNASLQENEEAINRKIRELNEKMERLEERFILEEITSELYQKYKSKFETEMEEIEAQKASNKIEMSRLEDYIATSLEFTVNLPEMWALGGYNQRQELQNALFSGGILYDRQKDECRSTGHNEFITEIARLQGSFGNIPNVNNKINQLTLVGARPPMSNVWKYYKKQLVKIYWQGPIKELTP